MTVRAVIGHGRSPEQQGWGRRIDACDVVIRMWECAWQGVADYGTRYDIGVLEVHRSVLQRFTQHNQRQPSDGWVASFLHSRLDRPDLLPDGAIVVDQRQWTRGPAGRAIAGVGETGKWELTRGGIAACWAIDQSAVGDTVILVGCDNLRAGTTLQMGAAFPQAYRLDEAAAKFTDYKAGVTKTGNHDFPAEMRLVQSLADRAGVQLAFAEDVWPLNRNKIEVEVPELQEAAAPADHRHAPVWRDWSLIWIIGGGPSAGAVATERLTGGTILGVNDAAFHKACHAFFSNDHNYALKTRGKIEKLGVDVHLSVKPHHIDRFRDWPATIWTRVFENEPSTRPGHLASGRAGVPGCSGYVALNLAAQMGARRIVLFGYDFAQSYRYFFNQAPYPRRDIAGVVASFRTVAAWYREAGIEILNANPASAIDAFRKITIEEAYQLAAR